MTEEDKMKAVGAALDAYYDRFGEGYPTYATGIPAGYDPQFFESVRKALEENKPYKCNAGPGIVV